MSGPGARAATEREEFAAFFPQIVRDLTEDGLGHPEVGDAVARLKQVSTGQRVTAGKRRDRTRERRARSWGEGGWEGPASRGGGLRAGAAHVAALPQVLEYNAPGGKCNRGLTVVAAFRRLAGPAQQQDPESLRCALAVGWCIELVRNGTLGMGPPRDAPSLIQPLAVPSLFPGG